MNLQGVKLHVRISIREALYESGNSVLRSENPTCRLGNASSLRGVSGWHSPILTPGVDRLPGIHHEFPVFGRKVLVGRLSY